jgi:hypothetical protein
MKIYIAAALAFVLAASTASAEMMACDHHQPTLGACEAAVWKSTQECIEVMEKGGPPSEDDLNLFGPGEGELESCVKWGVAVNLPLNTDDPNPDWAARNRNPNWKK